MRRGWAGCWFPGFALRATGGAAGRAVGQPVCPSPGVPVRLRQLPGLGSEQAPEERAAGDPSEGSQAGQPALQRADLRPLPAEPGPPQPQGQHLPGLQPLGVSGLSLLRPQQLLALQSLHQGGVSTWGQVAGIFCMLPLPPSFFWLPQLHAPWPTFPSPTGLFQCWTSVSAVTSRGGHPWLGDGELGHAHPAPFPPYLIWAYSPAPRVACVSSTPSSLPFSLSCPTNPISLPCLLGM